MLSLEAAVGELVNTTGAGQFAGYYKDHKATTERMRGGMYWSGDLAFRDQEGWIYKRELVRQGLDTAGDPLWERAPRGTSYSLH